MEQLEKGFGGATESDANFSNQHLGMMRVPKTKNYNPAEI